MAGLGPYRDVEAVASDSDGGDEPRKEDLLAEVIRVLEPLSAEDTTCVLLAVAALWDLPVAYTEDGE